MKIQLKNMAGGAHQILLEGDLDFHSSPDLRHELNRFLEAKTPKILVDLKKVTYIDSSGLATFVELFQRMKRYDGRLVLFNLTAAVRSVFEIAKLDSIFPLAASEQDALALVS